MITIKEVFSIPMIESFLNLPEFKQLTRDDGVTCFQVGGNDIRYLAVYDKQEIFGMIWFHQASNICAEFHPCIQSTGIGAGKKLMLACKKFEEWMTENTIYVKLMGIVPIQTCSATVNCAIRCGFEYEGLLKKHVMIHRQLQDCAVLGKFIKRGL